MRSLIFVAVFITMGIHPLWAQENTKQALAKELFHAMDMDKQMEESMTQVKEMQKQITANMPKLKDADGNPVEDEDFFKDFSVDQMKNDAVSIYAEVLTEEELHGLINFYKSDVGQKFVQKMPEITKRMMQVNQARTQAIQAKIMERMKAVTDKVNTMSQ